MSDWLRGNHLPREADELLKVVDQLAEWAGQTPPSHVRWRRLLEAAGQRATSSASPGVSSSGQASTVAALGDRLTAAFAEQHVRIDAMCLNGQSLSIAMGRPIHAIHTGDVRPERISLRVMLPSRDIDLAFPCAASVDEDQPQIVHRRWLSQRNAHGQSVSAALRSLRDTHDIDVEVSYRALPFTPMAKLYLVNGKEALFSYYTIVRRQAEIEQRPIEVFDPSPMGLVRLFGTDSTSDDTAFVKQSQLWFDSLWESVTTDLTFSS